MRERIRSWEQAMSLPPPRKFAMTSVIVLGVVTVSTVLLVIRHDRLLVEGQTLQFDDFFFTLVRVSRSLPLEGEPSFAARPMVRYAVTLKIDNRAKRVPFRFSESSLAIVDQANGGRFYVHAADQKAHDDAAGTHPGDPLILKAGESANREYVFRVPASAVSPHMRIAPGGWSGLVIDRVLTGLKEFQLP
jgi:hypothetical protein